MATRTKTGQTVIDLLLDQHTQIKRLFSDVLSATGENKRDRFYELVRLLAVHESAEELVVHPIARRSIADGGPIVVARLEEEDKAKHTLSDLYSLGVDHPEFDVRLRALGEDVVEHATAEETEEFAELRAALSPADQLRLAEAVRAAEAAAPTRPHPMAGESATANSLVGPPLAIFDRVRDALRNWAHT
jgi:hemerythrin superfamily protein